MSEDFSISSKNNRLIKYSQKLQSNLNFPLKQNQLQQDPKYFHNSKMHIPGRVNFYQLLSLPLEKQIHRENSFKENKTFTLKFQPQNSPKQLSKVFTLQQIREKPSQKTQSKFYNSLCQSQQQKLKNAIQSPNEEKNQQLKQAKTMYFKPLGKVNQNQENQNFQRKSLQIVRHKSFNKGKDTVSMNGFKDKLMMLLQIRRQQATERLKCTGGFRRHENKSFRLNREGAKQKILQDFNQERCLSSFSVKQYKTVLRKGIHLSLQRKEEYYKKRGEEGNNLSQITPWNLVQNVEQF